MSIKFRQGINVNEEFKMHCSVTDAGNMDATFFLAQLYSLHRPIIVESAPTAEAPVQRVGTTLESYDKARPALTPGPG